MKNYTDQHNTFLFFRKKKSEHIAFHLELVDGITGEQDVHLTIQPKQTGWLVNHRVTAKCCCVSSYTAALRLPPQKNLQPLPYNSIRGKHLHDNKAKIEFRSASRSIVHRSGVRYSMMKRLANSILQLTFAAVSRQAWDLKGKPTALTFNSALKI